MNFFRSRTLKTFLAALGISALSVGAFVYMLVSIHRAGDLLTERMRQLAGDRARESAHLSVEKLLADTAPERARLTAALLGGSNDTVTFLSEIDRYAAGIGITLSTDTLEVMAQKNEPYDVLKVTLSMEGSEAGVLQMLALLESWPYHGYVASATLERRTIPGSAPMHATVQLAVTIVKDTEP